MRDETIRKLMAATSAGVISAALMATPASAQKGRDRSDAGSFAQAGGETRSGQRGDVQIRAGERGSERARERSDVRVRAGDRSDGRIRAGDREDTRVSERSRVRSNNVRVGARFRDDNDIAVRSDRYVLRDDRRGDGWRDDAWRDDAWRYRRESWSGPAISFSVGNGYYGPYYESSYAYSGPYASRDYSDPYYDRDAYYGDAYYGYAAAPGCTCARDWRGSYDRWGW